MRRSPCTGSFLFIREEECIRHRETMKMCSEHSMTEKVPEECKGNIVKIKQFSIQQGEI